MESKFPPLDFDEIVTHLIQFFEVTMSEMTPETRKNFPVLFCRQLALCTHGQIQLVLTERDDLLSEQLSLLKRSFKTSVQYGRSYGILALLSPPQEPDDWHVAVNHTKMLARVCGFILWMFEFACSVPLPLFRPDARTIDSLTERERDVLRLLCQGWSLQEIAQRLGIEEATVERHQRQVRVKLRARHELEIPLIAFLSGFFSPLTD